MKFTVARVVSASRIPGIGYANVIAALALLIGLADVSYGALSLRSRSAGKREPEVGTFDVGALGRARGVERVTSSYRQELYKGACNSPSRPGEVSLLCAPPPPHNLEASPIRLRLRMRSSGRVLISAVAGIAESGAANTYGYVTYAVTLDGQPVAESKVSLAGGQNLRAPIRTLLRVTRGEHTIGFGASANYSSYEPGDATVSPVSLVALRLR